jgi:hypothetical protein
MPCARDPTFAWYVQEAQDIFGDVTDLLEEYTQRKQQPEDDMGYLDEELEDEDEDAAEERRILQVIVSSSFLTTSGPHLYDVQT